MKFNQILEGMKKVHDAKSHDYGNSLLRSKNMGIEPWVGVAIRMGDKMARIENFVRKGQLKVKDEKIRETFLDLANYCVLAVELLDG